jgi:hypothetical protein
MAEKTSGLSVVAPLVEDTPEDIAQNKKYQDAYDRAMASLVERRKPLFDPVLLAMAQGFLGPTKTGSFGEALGRAAESTGKAEEAEAVRQKEEAMMGLQAAGMSLEQARQKQQMNLLKREMAGEVIGEKPPQEDSGVVEGIQVAEPIKRLNKSEFFRRQIMAGVRDPAAIFKAWDEYQREGIKVSGDSAFNYESGRLITPGKTADLPSGIQPDLVHKNVPLAFVNRIFELRNAGKNKEADDLERKLLFIQPGADPSAVPSAAPAATPPAAPSAGSAQTSSALAAPASVVPSVSPAARPTIPVGAVPTPSGIPPLPAWPAGTPKTAARIALEAEHAKVLSGIGGDQAKEHYKALLDASLGVTTTGAKAGATKIAEADVAASELGGAAAGNVEAAKKESEEAAKISAASPQLRTDAREARKAALSTIGLVNQSPKAFGILDRPGILAAIGTMIKEGIGAGDVRIQIPGFEKALLQIMPGVKQKDINNVTEVASNLSQLELMYSKLYLKGQGTVTDSERKIVRTLGTTTSTNPEVIKAKARAVAMKADLEIQIADLWDDYKTANPTKNYIDFTRDKSSGYRGAIKDYDSKVESLLAPMAPKAPSPVKPQSDVVRDALRIIGR